MALIDGIISYYKLDETSGTVIDQEGNHDGTNNGATTLATGKIGTAYDFSSDDISLANSFSNNNVTVNAWVNADSLATTGKIIEVANGRRFAMDITNSAISMLGTTDSFKVLATHATVISTGSYVMVTVTYDGTTARIYVGASEIVNNAPGGGNLSSSTGSARIGSLQAGGAQYWDGKIDELGIWNRALTPTEITELYNSGAGFAYPFTTGWANKIFNIIPGKVEGITVANISKIQGVA